MMRRCRLFIILPVLALLASSGWAQDCVTRDFKDVQARAMALLTAYTPKDILLVFDIDNTLLAMNQDLGSNQWFDWQKYELKPGDPAKVENLLEAQGLLFAVSGMHPPQRDLPEIFSRLRAAGFPILALTSRGNEYRNAAERELEKNGYGFETFPVPLKNGNLVPCIGDDRRAAYLNGIFMTGGRNKGEMLDCLLKQAAASYKIVIMVDDALSNLEAVKAKVTGIAVETYLYNAEDGNVARFEKNPKDAVAADYWRFVRTLKEILR